jgi:hypothetical protein
MPETRSNEMQIDLSSEEIQFLKRITSRTLADTKAEVRHTETREYRDKLHDEEAMLVGLVERFSQAVAD